MALRKYAMLWRVLAAWESLAAMLLGKESAMTEQEWLAISDPLFMLEFFRRTSERKLRLFGVASCRRMWGLLTDKRSQQAVTAAEQFAEGLISQEAFEEAR